MINPVLVEGEFEVGEVVLVDSGAEFWGEGEEGVHICGVEGGRGRDCSDGQ